MRSLVLSHLFERSPSLSEVDSRTFGMGVVRATARTEESVAVAEQFAREKGARLIVLRSPTSSLSLLPVFFSQNYLLTDTLLYYGCSPTRVAKKGGRPRLPIRRARPEDAEELFFLAVDCFRSFPSHYHADPRLDRRKCAELYGNWFKRTALADDPDQILMVAEANGEIAGFGTICLHSESMAEAVLAAVKPSLGQQGLMVYRSLLQAGSWEVADRGIKLGFTSTQVQNVSIQKVWANAGWHPLTSAYTFHKWLS